MSKEPPLIWAEDPGTKYCVLTALRNVDDSYEISKGISRANGFPSGALFRMDKKFPKQVALSDNLANIEQIAVVSERLKSFIEKLDVNDVEFLKVKIVDHKDREISDVYYIMNPLAVIDCIDAQRSVLDWNAIDPDLIASVSSLVLTNTDALPVLFRPRHMEERVFVGRRLGEAITASKFTGLKFTEPSEFIG